MKAGKLAIFVGILLLLNLQTQAQKLVIAPFQDILVEDEDGEEYEVQIKGVVIDRRTQSPVVILWDERNKKFVPIWIGFAEARAIYFALQGIKPPRPITHDLLARMIKVMGGKVTKVKITKLENNTYYAYVQVKVGKKVYNVDSRPSDAIALALRVGAPIFISKQIMLSAVKIPEEEEKDFLWEKVGISVQVITPELEEFFKSKGLVVSDVKDNSPASGKIKIGDVIVKVNGKKVETPDDLVQELKEKGKATLTVKREDKELEVEIKIE